MGFQLENVDDLARVTLKGKNFYRPISETGLDKDKVTFNH